MSSSKKKPTGDYAIGYARPPENRQWSKGQSGNPNGQRPRHTDIDECIAEVLGETAVIEINGKKKRVTWAEAVARKIVHQALKGERGAQRELIQSTQRKSDCKTVGGWDIIVAKPVFEEEENRLKVLSEQREELLEQNAKMRELLGRDACASIGVTPVDQGPWSQWRRTSSS